MNLGERIDQLAELDRLIKIKEAAAKKLKGKRAKLESVLLEKFGKDKIDGCKGKAATATIRRASFPSIKDQRKFQKYVLKHRAFDLYHNRVASKAYFDRLKAGETVPGVTVFERVGISIKARR